MKPIKFLSPISGVIKEIDTDENEMYVYKRSKRDIVQDDNNIYAPCDGEIYIDVNVNKLNEQGDFVSPNIYSKKPSYIDITILNTGIRIYAYMIKNLIGDRSTVKKGDIIGQIVDGPCYNSYAKFFIPEVIIKNFQIGMILTGNDTVLYEIDKNRLTYIEGKLKKSELMGSDMYISPISGEIKKIEYYSVFNLPFFTVDMSKAKDYNIYSPISGKVQYSRSNINKCKYTQTETGKKNTDQYFKIRINDKTYLLIYAKRIDDLILSNQFVMAGCKIGKIVDEVGVKVEFEIDYCKEIKIRDGIEIGTNLIGRETILYSGEYVPEIKKIEMPKLDIPKPGKEEYEPPITKIEKIEEEEYVPRFEEIEKGKEEEYEGKILSPVSGVIRRIELEYSNVIKKAKIGVYIRGPHDEFKDDHNIYSPISGIITYNHFDGIIKDMKFFSSINKKGYIEFILGNIKFNVYVGDGYVTDQIDLYVKKGEYVEAGKKIGEIVFGRDNSYAEIFLNETIKDFNLGDVLVGGKTVINEPKHIENIKELYLKLLNRLMRNFDISNTLNECKRIYPTELYSKAVDIANRIKSDFNFKTLKNIYTSTNNIFTRETVLYRWLVDVLPKKFLKEYGVDGYNSLMSWESIKENFICKYLGSTGAFKKIFLLCSCEKIRRFIYSGSITYFVSEIDLGNIEKSLDRINMFWYIIKEFIISANLNLLHANTVLMGNELYPVCKNFIRTYYITTNNNMKKYYIFQDRMTTTLHEFLKKSKTPLSKDIIRYIYFQIVYALHVGWEWFGFMHNDLHPKNVMLLKVEDEDYNGMIYHFGEKKIFKIPKEFPYIVKIIDFNRSHINKPKEHLKYNRDVKVVNLLEKIFNVIGSFSYDSYGALHKKSENFEFSNDDLYRLHYGIDIGRRHYDGIRDLINKKFFDEEFLEMIKSYYKFENGGLYKKLIQSRYFGKLKIDELPPKQKLNKEYSYFYTDKKPYLIEEYYMEPVITC